MRVTEGLITDKYLFTNSKIAEKKLKLQTQLTTNSKFENMLAFVSVLGEEKNSALKF